jgi:hypothetical protein
MQYTIAGAIDEQRFHHSIEWPRFKLYSVRVFGLYLETPIDIFDFPSRFTPAEIQSQPQRSFLALPCTRGTLV